jgi:hypothetical protein
MYYIEEDDDEIMVHEANGAPYFEIFVNGKTGCNLSGNILSVSFEDGHTEVYDVNSRCRIR